VQFDLERDPDLTHQIDIFREIIFKFRDIRMSAFMELFILEFSYTVEHRKESTYSVSLLDLVPIQSFISVSVKKMCIVRYYTVISNTEL
jgi:hypothetical protein